MRRIVLLFFLFTCAGYAQFPTIGFGPRGGGGTGFDSTFVYQYIDLSKTWLKNGTYSIGWPDTTKVKFTWDGRAYFGPTTITLPAGFAFGAADSNIFTIRTAGGIRLAGFTSAVNNAIYFSTAYVRATTRLDAALYADASGNIWGTPAGSNIAFGGRAGFPTVGGFSRITTTGVRADTLFALQAIFGLNNTVTGLRSASLWGQNNVVTGDSAAAGGGYNRATGAGSMAFGTSNLASGALSRAFGLSNTASGSGSTVFGQGSSATNNWSFASGFACTAGQQAAVAMGQSATASQLAATAIGYDVLASGEFTLATGRGSEAKLPAARAHSSGGWAVSGDSQLMELVLRDTTSNAVPDTLTLNPTGADVVANRYAVIDTGTTWAYTIQVSARSQGGSSAAYMITGAIENVAGTVAMIGTPTITVLGEDDSSWDATVAADDGNNALAIIVTGAAGAYIRWSANVRIQQTKW